MFKTLRSQVLLYITLAMLVSSAVIVTLTYYEIESEINEREEKSINNISNFINLVIENEFDSLLDYKTDITYRFKQELKSLVSLYVYTNETKDDIFNVLLDRFKRLLENNSYYSDVEWLLLKEGNVALSSCSDFQGANTESFINMKEESIGSRLTGESLRHEGDFVVFYLSEGKERKWRLGFFLPFGKGRDTIIANMIDIKKLMSKEHEKKKNIINKIKNNLPHIVIARSGFAFMFNGRKEMLVRPTPIPEKKDFENFLDRNKQYYLERFMQTSREGSKKAFNFQLPDSKKEFSIYTTYFKGFDWYISIAIPTDEITEPARTFAIELITIIIFIFILCIIFSIYLVSKATKPLEILSRNMEKFSNFDFKNKNSPVLTRNLPVSVNNEIGLLAQNFADMASKLAVNVQQLVEATASNERIEGELNAAREIQLGILPINFSFEPERKALDIYAYLVPAREIGGDLYDFFFIDDEHLCFTVGDVAGKGVPAALFMVIAKKLINCNAHQQIGKISPAVIMNQINSILYKDNPSSIFITLLIAILNVKTGEMRYANGGHVPPIFVDCGSEPRYRKDLSGPVVGVIPGIQYKDIVTALQPGGAVFLCTDGVTEAMNEDEKLFGDRRLLSEFAKMKDKPCKEVVDGILYEVRAYAGNALQSDDIAMLMVRWGVEKDNNNSERSQDL